MTFALLVTEKSVLNVHRLSGVKGFINRIELTGSSIGTIESCVEIETRIAAIVALVGSLGIAAK